jgi:hypothetical protein
MKAIFFPCAASLALLATAPVWADGPRTPDIKRAVPTDAYLAVYARHNPKRDYQREYFLQAWQTFKEERIGERLMDIVVSRVPEKELAAAKSRWQELKTALEPVNGRALLNADEIVVAEVMEPPFNEVLIAARLTATDAADCEHGIVQVGELIARWSKGKVAVQTHRVKDATMTVLSLPKESPIEPAVELPIEPAVARLNDIVLMSTSAGLLRRSVERLQEEAVESKFDDPRLKEALAHLPKPDDAVVFLDGRKLFENLHGIAAFIRSHAENDENAVRLGRLVDRVVNETAILDFEVTVESTEPGRNRTVAFIKLADDFDSKLLGRALARREPFDNWQTWVPKDATAFSLSTGVNLHELYGGIIALVRDEFPESKKGLEQFAQWQRKVGVDLDRDILQSFSGESVSVTVPVKAAVETTRLESVKALRCQNPDKIRELLARAVDGLNTIPALHMQQLKLDDCKDLKGFQELHATIFQMVGVQPVIGFRDGWMVLASSKAAAEKVLAARAGQLESIDGAALFEKLGLEPKGAVYDLSYHDIGATIRAVADAIDKFSAVARMILGIAAEHAKPEDLKPVEEALGLLPSVAKVIRKFDFFGHNLSVTRKGPLPNTYLRESVTEVRMAK